MKSILASITILAASTQGLVSLSCGTTGALINSALPYSTMFNIDDPSKANFAISISNNDASPLEISLFDLNNIAPDSNILAGNSDLTLMGTGVSLYQITFTGFIQGSPNGNILVDLVCTGTPTTPVIPETPQTPFVAEESFFGSIECDTDKQDCAMKNIYVNQTKKIICGPNEKCAGTNFLADGIALEFESKANSFIGGSIIATDVMSATCNEGGCADSSFNFDCVGSGCILECNGALTCSNTTSLLANPRSVICDGSECCKDSVYTLNRLDTGSYSKECIGAQSCMGNVNTFYLDKDANIRLTYEDAMAGTGVNIVLNNIISSAITIDLTIICKKSMACGSMDIKTNGNVTLDDTINCEPDACGTILVNGVEYQAFNVVPGSSIATKTGKMSSQTVAIISIASVIAVVLVLVVVFVLLKNHVKKSKKEVESEMADNVGKPVNPENQVDGVIEASNENMTGTRI